MRKWENDAEEVCGVGFLCFDLFGTIWLIFIVIKIVCIIEWVHRKFEYYFPDVGKI